MYKVFVSDKDDIHNGWVWAKKVDIKQRPIVSITNKANQRKIFCECLQIDENFLKEYNQPPRIKISESDYPIIMNEWYRSKLGINKNSECDLEIKSVNSNIGYICAGIKACLDHPQISVRQVTWLGLGSGVLGIIGLLIALLAFSNLPMIISNVMTVDTAWHIGANERVSFEGSQKSNTDSLKIVSNAWKLISCSQSKKSCTWGFKLQIKMPESLPVKESNGVEDFGPVGEKIQKIEYCLYDRDGFKVTSVIHQPDNVLISQGEDKIFQVTGVMSVEQARRVYMGMAKVDVE